MKNYENLYCKLFVDTDEDYEYTVNLISNIISAKSEKWNITSNIMEIEVNKNEDFDKLKRFENIKGFLFSRYYLDIDPKTNINVEDYISSIAKLLEGLWSNGFKATAACDFEEELPRKGGYRFNI